MISRDALDAVVFDMDGVLVDSEGLWQKVLEQPALDCGTRWTAEAQEMTIGLARDAATRYMHSVVGFDLPPAEIRTELEQRMMVRYGDRVPAMPGAVAAVQRLAAAGLRLGVASSSSRRLIDCVVGEMGLAAHFAAVVSGDDVAQGKPAPDIYLEAARLLRVSPARCAAVEDSGNGIRPADAAGFA